MARTKLNIYFLSGAFFIGAFSLLFVAQDATSISYDTDPTADAPESHTMVAVQGPEMPDVRVAHIDTPESVRAVYITSWVAGTEHMRERIINLVEETELNSVVIDIKDYSGKLAFPIDHPRVAKEKAAENRIPEIKRLIADLHRKDIYVIGRITVFQDPHYALRHPDVAVQKESDKSVWEDYKGLSFVDAGAQEFWEYTVVIAEESYKLGFDELNFDYIRFPSDGDMQDIYYPISEERIMADSGYGKADVIEEFFAYLHAELEGTGAVTSADLFGMVTTNYDDLNIGQVLERAAPYFDYIAPMVYPSHFPKGFNGWENPNKYPYEIIEYSMRRGAERLRAASTSPDKLRPWLQDFDYGGNYGAEEVRAQIQGAYDAGLDSWMLWDPANRYTREALDSTSN